MIGNVTRDCWKDQEGKSKEEAMCEYVRAMDDTCPEWRTVKRKDSWEEGNESSDEEESGWVPFSSLANGEKPLR